jgi:hypothetical protein
MACFQTWRVPYSNLPELARQKRGSIAVTG